MGCASLSWGADSTLLWYDKPATDWEKEALPIGNGRMGAMVFGGVQSERLQISEKSLWTGGPGAEGGYDYGLPAESQAAQVSQVGKQLLDGSTLAPEPLARQLGRKMQNYGDYQSFGDLIIESSGAEGEVGGYRRELDLATAMARVRYRQGFTGFLRDYFISYPDQVLVARWFSTNAQKLRVRFAVPDNRSAETHIEIGKTGGRLVVSGALKSNGLRYAVALLMIPLCSGVQADGDAHDLRGRLRRHLHPHRAHQLPDALSGLPRRRRGSGRGCRARCQRRRRPAVFTSRAAPRRGLPGAVRPREARSRRGREQTTHRPAARPVRQRQCRGRPRARAAVFQLRALPADRGVAPGLAARQPAGRVERQGHAAVECRLPRQHQPADELLAGGGAPISPRPPARCSISSTTWSRPESSPRSATSARRAGPCSSTPMPGVTSGPSTGPRPSGSRKRRRGWRSTSTSTIYSAATRNSSSNAPGRS